MIYKKLTTEEQKREIESLARKAKYVFIYLVLLSIFASGVILVIKVIEMGSTKRF